MNISVGNVTVRPHFIDVPATLRAKLEGTTCVLPPSFMRLLHQEVELYVASAGTPQGELEVTVLGDPYAQCTVLPGIDPDSAEGQLVIAIARVDGGRMTGLADMIAVLTSGWEEPSPFRSGWRVRSAFAGMDWRTSPFGAGTPQPDPISEEERKFARVLIARHGTHARCPMCQGDCPINRAIDAELARYGFKRDMPEDSLTPEDLRQVTLLLNQQTALIKAHVDRQVTMLQGGQMAVAASAQMLNMAMWEQLMNSPANRLARAALNVFRGIGILLAAAVALVIVVLFWRHVLFALICVAAWPIAFFLLGALGMDKQAFPGYEHRISAWSFQAGSAVLDWVVYCIWPYLKGLAGRPVTITTNLAQQSGMKHHRMIAGWGRTFVGWVTFRWAPAWYAANVKPLFAKNGKPKK